MKLFGYRKVIIAGSMLVASLVPFGIIIGLYMAGSPVNELQWTTEFFSWLSVPLASFFTFNGIEHLPKAIEAFKKIKK